MTAGIRANPTTPTLTLDEQIELLRSKLPALALDGDTADLERVEAEIAGLLRQQERQRLAGIEQARRDAEASRQAASEAAEAERCRREAERKRRLACYATITEATAQLMAAIDELGRLSGSEEQQLVEHICGELTHHNIHIWGLSAPRRPLPTNEVTS